MLGVHSKNVMTNLDCIEHLRLCKKSMGYRSIVAYVVQQFKTCSFTKWKANKDSLSCAAQSCERSLA